MYRYVIFDMDGTLIDSMPAWRSLGRDYLAAHGVTPPPNLRDIIAPMTLAASTDYFVREFGVPGPSDRVLGEMLGQMHRLYRSEFLPREGAVEHLAMLRRHGVHMAVATAAEQQLALTCFRRLGMDGYFEFVLSCETLNLPKNTPDIYHLASGRWGVSPDAVAVYEDAPYAARTARQAGYFTVGVEDGTQEARSRGLYGVCDVVIRDFPEQPF